MFQGGYGNYRYKGIKREFEPLYEESEIWGENYHYGSEKKMAVIMPIEKDEIEEKVIQLVQRDIACWSGGKPKGMRLKIKSKGKRVYAAVIEDRR